MVIDNIDSDLRTNFTGPFSTTTEYIVRGYYEPGDEGGGVFIWIIPSGGAPVLSDDGGIIINNVNDSTGYFKRLYSGTINVKWFGAIGKGNTADDDQPAIQAALDYYQNQNNNRNEGCEAVYIPKGVYYINSGLQFIGDTTATDHSNGLKLLGDGQKKSIIKPLFSTGSALEIDGTGGSNYYIFQKGGYIRDINFDGSEASASGTLVGLQLRGWWYFKIEDCIVENFSSHAIYMPKDDNSNPDGYNVVGEFRRLSILRNGGLGWYGENGQGSAGSIISHCYIIANKGGGIWLAGTNMLIADSSIAYNGDPDNQTGIGLHFGIRVYPLQPGQSTQAIEYATVCHTARNEFDTNFGDQIKIEGMHDSTFEENRLLYNDLSNVPIYNLPATNFFVLDPVSMPTYAANIFNIIIRQTHFRLSLGGVGNSYTGFDFNNQPQTINVQIVDNVFSEEVSGLNLNKYNYSPSVSWNSNYKTTEFNLSSGTYEWIDIGKPRPNDIKACGYVYSSAYVAEGFNIDSVVWLSVGHYQINYKYPLFNRTPFVVATPIQPMDDEPLAFAKAHINYSIKEYAIICFSDSSDNFIDIDFMFHVV